MAPRKAATKTTKPKAAKAAPPAIDAALLREIWNAQNDSDGCMYLAKDDMAAYIEHEPALVEFHAGMVRETGKGKTKKTLIAFRLTQDGITKLAELEGGAAASSEVPATEPAPAPAPDLAPPPVVQTVMVAPPVPDAPPVPGLQMAWVGGLPQRKRSPTKNSKYKFADLMPPRADPTVQGGIAYHSFFIPNSEETPDAPRALSSAVANYKKQFGTPNGKTRKGRGGKEIPLMDYTVDFEVYSVFDRETQTRVIGAACYRIK